MPRLPPDLVRKVRRIELATLGLVDRGIAGGYHSVFKGRGMEFAEVRPYQPGDDHRALDWNVTARLGEPYVKRFVEERDLTVMLAVDVSGSLAFGSRAVAKRELAAEVAALVSFAALRNQDRVGTALIADGLVRHLPPGRRRSHVLRLVAEILSRPAGGATDLEAGLHSLLAALDRRVVLFILSDFLDASLERALKAARRHDVVLVEILDPHDVDPPETAPVVLRDAESGRSVLFGDTLGGLLTGKRAARRLRDERRRQRSALLQQARRLGLDHLTLWTHRPYLPPLLAFFEARRRRLRHG
ncbi:MAG: DUF58 domain-containing protein [Acidobacteria bacterium]|nr:DUF58 domain-containing protein [Acidobacteriota bacterium]